MPLLTSILMAVGLASGAPDSFSVSWVNRLGSNQQVEWREAQIRLANHGPAMLPLLEKLLRSSPERTAPRISSLLAAALLQSVHAEDLGPDSALSALAASDLARASRVADVLGRQGAVVPDSTEAAFAVVRHLQGFAVPAGLRLCASPNPIARAYGIGVLETVRANIALDVIGRLQSDQAEARTLGDDWVGDIPISKTASNAIVQMAGWERPDLKIRQAWLAVSSYERYPDTIVYQLIEGIAQTSNTWDAPNAEAWWELARPAWTEWWKAAGDAPWPSDLDAWARWTHQHHPQAGSK